MLPHMVQFGKKKNYTDWLYTRPVLFFLGVLILMMGISVFQRFGVERDMYARRIEAETARQEAAERKMELEEKVEYLEGERGIEEEIRKHFDVAREGEQVVILMGETEPEPEAAEPEPEQKRKWYQFWR